MYFLTTKFLITKSKSLFFTVLASATLVTFYIFLMTSQDNFLLNLDVRFSRMKYILNFRPNLPKNKNFDYNYVDNPYDACLMQSNIELVVAVHVSRSQFILRQAIRETWAKDAGSSVVVLFFLGKGVDQEPVDIEKNIQMEFLMYRDIVEEDYIDSYENLTLKSLSMLKWVSGYCRRSKFLLKTDSDMYVSIPNVLKALDKIARTLNASQPFISGHLMENTVPVRDPNLKWYTSFEVYDKKTYPTYVIGASYAMTTSAAQILYTESSNIPLFWIEDVYINGVCAEKAGVVRIKDPSQTPLKLNATGCSFKTEVSTSHGFTPLEILKIYSDLHDPKLLCKNT